MAVARGGTLRPFLGVGVAMSFARFPESMHMVYLNLFYLEGKKKSNHNFTE
jgi:hypothetical protein